jgi:hypothetical protein
MPSAIDGRQLNELINFPLSLRVKSKVDTVEGKWSLSESS